MDEKQECGTCAEVERSAESCCQVEAVVTVDERGQMVLPKEVRDKLGLRGGDKLGLVLFEKEGRVCCISLIPMQDMSDMVRDMLGPVMKDILG
jgi:antitoxin PrlF